MTTHILAAGDHFVLNRLFIEALEGEADLSFTTLTLPWPLVPFGQVGEVHEASGTEDELIEALQGVEICLTQMAPLTERILAAAEDLRLFCISRGGPVNANLEAATRRGVGVCFAPGRNAEATAEHSLALMLAAMRRVPEAHVDLLQGSWRSDYYSYDNVGPELLGSTVGLVGGGAVGGRLARMLAALGADVVVYDPYLEAEALAGVATQVELTELLSRSNIVSLHARATAATNGLIGAAELAAMPSGSVLVNCARGTLLDYSALCDALDAGHLFGAAVDVFPEEPIPLESRLLRTPHLVMTPHLGGASKQTAVNAARIVAVDVRNYLRGQPLAYCANPEALGHPH